MTTITFDVRTLEDNLADFAEAWKTGQPSDPRISFATPELLWQALTAKRWQILQTMAGTGPLSIRELARRVQRDVKAVHADVMALRKAGIVEKTAEGKIHFPYDAIHVDFVMKAAA